MWMARSEEGEEIWGTWEELLLASAVSRHGVKDWGSVAAVVGERTAFPHLLTAEVCEQRYRDLCLRFQGEGRPHDGSYDAVAIPWLDDLRRLRVAELRREVQRHDVSIVSLQSKVRKLTEERERSFKEEGDGGDAPDPEGSHRKSNGNLLPDPVVAGERSGRSCNESNSPETKEEGRDAPREGREKKPKPPEEAGTPPAKPDPVTGGEDKAAGEGSCNGSSETVVMGKCAGAVNVADDAGGEVVPTARAPDSGESMAESTGEETATKDSSDVQSSASPSRRRKRGGRRKPSSATATAISGGNSDGDSKVDLSGKSQPLVVLLEIIRSHKYGSIFERRHDSQDSLRYRSLIRQHMDLETVGKKLEDGGSYTVTEFFRDLLLLCANAVVFFPKDSAEHNAATHLRKLLHKEYASLNQKPSQLSPPLDAPVPLPPPVVPVAPRPPAPPRQPQSVTSKPKNEPELLTSLLDKVSPTPPLSACRKRSSLSAKAVSTSVKAAKEEAPLPPPAEKSDMEKELESTEKVVKEKPEKPVARGLRTTKTRGPMMKKPNLPIPTTDAKPKVESKEDSTTEPAKAPVVEKKNSSGNAGSSVDVPPPVPIAKKRSAAGFLNRLKGATSSPSPSNGEKAQPANNIETGGGITRSANVEQRKGLKDDKRKEKHEASGPPKRSVGRPPKRPPPTPPSQPPAKRAREAEAEAPAPAAKKRGRK